ncbi:MAG: GGDEF domain-containing protein [Alphaproteobacteria bacterium]|nr:GGDEF domain-containing protein [Alphaproteobacteria bacterium]
MEYPEKFEQALSYAGQAFDLMKKHQVPAHPGNFAVWYTYVSGNYPDLKRAVDILISNKMEFDERVSMDLRQKFFGHESESQALHKATQRIEGMLGQMMGFLGDAVQGANSYGETLKSFSDTLTDKDKMGDIRDMLRTVMTETRSIAEANQELEVKLDSSAKEIKQLRENLDEVKRESMTDALTTIANRKLFDIVLRESAMQIMETGEPLCLAMIDIDFFKKFNDTYGHQMGDQVLKLVARTLVDSVKGQDTAARYGGEEFSVIFPKTDLKNALAAAENIRNNVANKQVTNKRTGQSLGQITLSIGVSEYSLGEPLSQFIQRADEALYLSKRSGRNRVSSETDLEHSKLELKE